MYHATIDNGDEARDTKKGVRESGLKPMPKRVGAKHRHRNQGANAPAPRGKKPQGKKTRTQTRQEKQSSKSVQKGTIGKRAAAKKSNKAKAGRFLTL